MVCKDRDSLTLEGPIEGFLRREGFRVLNRASIQRSYGRPSGIDVDIFGLDKKRRLVKFRSLPAPKDVVRLQGYYSVEFRTPPPTQRASEIEDALLKFVSDELRCEIRQVNRDENGADAADLYEDEVRAAENSVSRGRSAKWLTASLRRHRRRPGRPRGRAPALRARCAVPPRASCCWKQVPGTLHNAPCTRRPSPAGTCICTARSRR